MVEPMPPDDASLLRPGWDRIYGNYVTELTAAGEDCRSRLAAVRRLVDEGKP